MVALLQASAQAQGVWPTRPVKIIVPLSPGGTADAVARLLSDKLSAAWGHPVVVDNKPGGSGIIGTDALAKSAPDGYTLGIGTINTHITNQFVYSKIPYDTEKDFSSITLLTTSPLFLITRKSLPVQNLNEFIDYAKANPGKLSYATIGTGSSMHLATEMLLQRAKISAIHVPYKGMGAAMQDLLAGNVDFTIDISGMSQVKTGKLKALGVASAKRYPNEPTVPSFAEQGIDQFEVTAWLSLHAPAGLPLALQKKINSDVNKALLTPEIKEKIQAMNLDVKGGTSDELNAHLSSERKKFSAVVRNANIKGE
jgi:tripartite-type tricarboxylate transporter receptor subunit TctC